MNDQLAVGALSTVTPREVESDSLSVVVSVDTAVSADAALGMMISACTFTLAEVTLSVMSEMLTPVGKIARRPALNAAWSNDSTAPATRNVDVMTTGFHSPPGSSGGDDGGSRTSTGGHAQHVPLISRRAPPSVHTSAVQTASVHGSDVVKVAFAALPSASSTARTAAAAMTPSDATQQQTHAHAHTQRSRR